MNQLQIGKENTMMRKFFLIIWAVIALMISGTVQAQQKYAYIYSQKIFKAIPEYNTAVSQLDQYVKDLEKQLQDKLDDVKKRFENYRNEEPMLSADIQAQRRAEIIRLEREATRFQESIYADDGLIKQKQDELMKPIEERVLAVVNALAEENRYDMIFDLSIAKITVFQSPSLDLTDTIIKRLGY